MKRILSAIIALVLLISILPVQQINAYAARKTTNITPTQEVAMSRYLIKTANISYRNKNYTVYRVNKFINTKADDFTVIYFDQKGNLLNDKKTYFKLRKLYVMGVCKEPLQTYKNFGGALIPSLILGKRVVEITGDIGIKVIVSKGELVKGIIAEGLEDGVFDFGNASIVWAFQEWTREKGLKDSLDDLYKTKKGISVSKKGDVLTINDNFKHHPFRSVNKMYSNWLSTYFRYGKFLDLLDKLELTVNSEKGFVNSKKGFVNSAKCILDGVVSIFAGTLELKLGDIPELKKEYKEFIKLFDLEDVSITWDPEKGFKLESEEEDIAESLISFFDNLLDYSTDYEDEVNAKISSLNNSSDSCYNIRQIPTAAEGVVRVINPNFVLPPRK